ncbi:MAG: protein TolR [Desulfosarcina sp.]|nr:protein TolR [Desulfobacterales bacterium]
MIYKGNNDNLMSDINVTPFVDVMLVLLIIFMVTAPMMVQGVNVSLPEVAAKSLPAQAENLVITIVKNGGVYINDYQVEFNFLQEKLSKIMDGRKDREVFLKADKEISYGMVVQVMSEIKNAGVEKIGMVTEPASTKKNRKKA